MAIADTRAWVEVDLDALRANYDAVRRSAGSAMIPVVKADAYGVGVGRVVTALEPRRPWGYAVATAAEGRQLREELDVTRPILVLAPLPPGDVDEAARAALTAAVSSVEQLDAWAAAAERVEAPLDFHVEVDTGMGRSGFDWREVAAWAPAVHERTGPAARWPGVFTHFHSADGRDPAPTERQRERFRETLVQLPVPRESLTVHAAASGAALRWPDELDAVRPGIFLYGGDPAPGLEEVPAPEPVVSVRARVVLARTVPAGTTVGYGATYEAGGPERWATLAIGYGDGLPRALGNRGHALVAGTRVPIIGRVSMDVTTVRLDGVGGVRMGDVATLIGRDGVEEVTVDQVAEQAGTIGYEILTGLGRRLPRIDTSSEESETA